MKDYQALTRRYRPQKFFDVLGQEAVVTALANAITAGRVSHAYLLSGSRGTGKTTLARLLAKAINCPRREGSEPCNLCESCTQITGGISLDVMEIDGASNRGIDDIRALNESAPYATASGRTKVYIIDEVHMLTKEAFNALLKTLEEPPPNVKFVFATTEPERVPATIISRCQRFQLNRIPTKTIAQKLTSMAADLGVDASVEALDLISQMADGALRDAESLFDQVLCFHGEKITADAVAAVLGLLPRDSLFMLDKATEAQELGAVFAITAQLFGGGKNSSRFLADLIDHYRTLLLLLIDQETSLDLSDTLVDRYRQSAKLYTKPQVLAILDDLVETAEAMKGSSCRQFALEMLLTRIVRSRQRVPLEVLVKRVLDLEEPQQEDVASPPPLKQEKGGIDYNTAIRFAAVELEGSVE